MRALAVLVVIFYHYFPMLCPGGFIGVDVFFVISGFVITPQLVNEHKLSLVSFYQRRIKRIFPALIIALIFCYVLARPFLIPYELKQLCEHIWGAATFSLNFTLQHEQGYFDRSADLKPLLHLWSLSIEEQFYLFFPLLIYFCQKVKWSLLLVLVILTSLSFGLNFQWISSDFDTAFYPTLGRVWEILLGALLYLNKGQVFQRLQHKRIVGLGLILFSTQAINLLSVYPVFRVIFPTIGAMLILIDSNYASKTFQLLSNPILVFIGKISYSLYLFHWILLSITKIALGTELNVILKIGLLLLTLLLSILVWKFVEQPVRKSDRQVFWTLLLLVSMLMIIISVQFKMNTVKINISKAQLNIQNLDETSKFFNYLKDHFYPCQPRSLREQLPKFKETPRCFQSMENALPSVVLIGDSHAEHLFPGLATQMKNQNLAYYIIEGPPFSSEKLFNEILNTLKTNKNIKYIIWANNWSLRQRKWSYTIHQAPTDSKTVDSFVLNLEKTINSLEFLNVKIFLLEDTPRFEFDPSFCRGERPMPENHQHYCKSTLIQFSEQASELKMLNKVLSKKPQVIYVPTVKYFCERNICSMKQQKRILFRDNEHLNIEGSNYLGEKIFNFISKKI